MLKNKNVIVKFQNRSESTVGEITKIVGLLDARYMVPIIDCLNLEANPRSSKTGSVTDAIQESIEKEPALFPFKTKGILLASSEYRRLERDRISFAPDDKDIEGILDGGHNTLAIGLYILKKSLENVGEKMPKGSKTWEEFKKLWEANKSIIDDYLLSIKNNTTINEIEFLIPIELLVPRDMNDEVCTNTFKNQLLEVCAARNNNVQLQVSAKANQLGYFDMLKDLMDKNNKMVSDRIEWKTNDGGDIKAQDIIALSWIALNMIEQVRDENGRMIECVAPNKLYSSKGSCLKQFEKLMSSPDVTIESDDNYKRQLCNDEVETAFEITVELPVLYDYIYEMFPSYYNAAGGSYGRITAVKALNEKRKKKVTPFTNRSIETMSPDGFVIPLVYGLQALMKTVNENGRSVIRWSQPPMPFLVENLEEIVKSYSQILSVCDYEPQKVGKAPISYNQALQAFKMKIAGII